MGIENVRRIIEEMKAKPLDMIPELLDGNIPHCWATDEQIQAEEERLGIKLPESYKLFLKEYSNGDIYLFAAEPLVGVRQGDTKIMCEICIASDGMGGDKNYYEKNCYILPFDKTVKIKQLVSMTFGDVKAMSNDQWVFICDQDYPDNDYPIGFLSGSLDKIVCVLNNFEKWLEIFWEGNRNRNVDYEAVFYLLYTEYRDRLDLLANIDDLSFEDFKVRYKEIRAKNDANFRKYGITDGK